MVHLLTKLFKNGTIWDWGPEQEIAFQVLKAALINAELLAYPDPSKPFFLHTDASIHGLGVCLMQHDKDDDRFFCHSGICEQSAVGSGDMIHDQ